MRVYMRSLLRDRLLHESPGEGLQDYWSEHRVRLSMGRQLLHERTSVAEIRDQGSTYRILKVGISVMIFLGLYLLSLPGVLFLEDLFRLHPTLIINISVLDFIDNRCKTHPLLVGPCVRTELVSLLDSISANLPVAFDASSAV